MQLMATLTAASMPTAATLPTGRPTKRLRDGRAKLAVAEIARDAGLSAPATSLAFGLRTVASIGEAVCRGKGILHHDLVNCRNVFIFL